MHTHIFTDIWSTFNRLSLVNNIFEHMSAQIYTLPAIWKSKSLYSPPLNCFLYHLYIIVAATLLSFFCCCFWLLIRLVSRRPFSHFIVNCARGWRGWGVHVIWPPYQQQCSHSHTHPPTYIHSILCVLEILGPQLMRISCHWTNYQNSICVPIVRLYANQNRKKQEIACLTSRTACC